MTRKGTDEFPSLLVSRLSVFREQSLNNGNKIIRYIRRQTLKRRGCRVRYVEHQGSDIVPLERLLTGQQLIKYYTE